MAVVLGAGVTGVGVAEVLGAGVVLGAAVGGGAAGLPVNHPDDSWLARRLLFMSNAQFRR